jgi:putative glutamine amidotransferase
MRGNDKEVDPSLYRVEMNKTKASKPVIGVIPLYDIERESLWMLPGYFDGIRDAGGLPFMLPLDIPPEDLLQLCKLCDGFLFTGGQDVDPELYHESVHPLCGEICKQRDSIEKTVFNMAYREDIPVLGICRGIQLINVLMGGSLYQDLTAEFSGTVHTQHCMTPPYNKAAHTVEIVDGTPLGKLLQMKEINVNSYHHQAVRRLAPGLTAMGYSPDGIVEAVYCKDRKFLWLVQWHPEFNYKVEATSALIFREFVRNCGY